MGHLASFNSHAFATVGYAVTGSLASSFTLDEDEIYLVKSIRLTNYSAAGTTVDIKFYDGGTSTEFWVSKSIPVNTGCSIVPFSDSPLVLSGFDGDELRMLAADASAVEAVITYMEMGREAGF